MMLTPPNYKASVFCFKATICTYAPRNEYEEHSPITQQIPGHFAKIKPKQSKRSQTIT